MAAKRIALDPEQPLRSALAGLGLTQEQAAAQAGVQRSALGNAVLRGEGITVRALQAYLAGLGRRLVLAAVEKSEGDT